MANSSVPSLRGADGVGVPVGGTTGQVLAKISSTNFQTAWVDVEEGGVTSVNTRTGAVTLTSTDVGLANVNNTSDANKPVSTATQTQLNLKPNRSRMMRAISTKSGAYGGAASNTIGGGSQTSTTTHVRHQAPTDFQCSELRFAFSNWFGGSLEANNINNISIKSEVVWNSVVYPLLFDGKRTVTIEPGGTIWSDILGLEIPAGNTFFTSTYVSVGAGERWPLGRVPRTAILEGNNLGLDTTGSATWAATTGDNVYAPSGIIGICNSMTVPSVAYFGDSLGVGFGGGSGDANGNQGYLEIAFAGRVGYIYGCQSGDTLGNYNSRHDKRHAIALNSVDSVVIEYGRNDITNSISFVGMQALYQTAWDRLTRRGLKVFQTTITPRTSSSDSWATLVNQTQPSTAQELVRTQVNDWIRTTPAPLSGYIEVADVAESSRNSGLWAVNGTPNYATPDGVHPGQTMYTLMAAAVNVSVFL